MNIYATQFIFHHDYDLTILYDTALYRLSIIGHSIQSHKLYNFYLRKAKTIGNILCVEGKSYTSSYK